MAYIFIFLSVVITVSHSINIHHHHSEIEVAESHHHHDGDNDDQDHSLFSFGQLDECYIQSSYQVNLNTNFIFLSIVNTFFSPELIGKTKKQEFNIAEDYPPDDPYSKSYSLRGPPIS